MVDRAGRDRLVHVVEIAAVEHAFKPLEGPRLELLARHHWLLRIVFQPVERYSNPVQEVKTRQQIAAEETQRAIVEAAARLFAVYGYHATSIGRIASEAGVAVQTIYNSLGSKRAILSRVLDFAAAGDRAPARVPRFMLEQAEQEPDPR